MTSWWRSIKTFYPGCMVSEITRFYCMPDMTSPFFLSQGALTANFRDGFRKTDHDFLIAFHTNFLSRMHGFRDNEVLLQAGYDIMVISPLGALQAIFHNGFWKSDHDFLIAFYTNVSHRFCGRNLKKRLWFHWLISRISHRFGVIRHFIVGLFQPILGVFSG